MIALRRQADENSEGKWGLGRTTFLCIVVLFLLSHFVLSDGGYYRDEKRNWQEVITAQFNDRLKFLEDSPFVLYGSAADIYHSYARSIATTLQTQDPHEGNEEAVFDLGTVWYWINRSLASALLRIGFVVIAFWPLWILSGVIGLFALQKMFKSKRTDDALGVLHRGDGPFYSGIWGPLKPNHSISGTDLSCPSLACPKLEPKNNALSSKLSALLKEYNAFNETNTDLVRVILAHGDYPSFVAEENPAYDENEHSGPADEERVSQTGFITNEKGTLKDGSVLGLQSVLEAHARIAQYVGSLEKKGVKSAALNKNFASHISNVKKLLSNVNSPLAQQLITALTATRLWALGHLPATVVASAYLATEAGKCLVYKRHEGGFVRISNYPHLQARAVIQSFPSYHREYDGDTRLIVRQAIICSRRHGDFGRAFLPNRMPVESRALRDWLEILYAETEKRTETSYLVELDAHIEEIGINWKLGFSSRLKQSVNQLVEKPRDSIWKGVPFKSVVLMPLEDVVSVALQGVHQDRLGRIYELFAMTGKHQARISISARLPGFKRQAMEAERSGEISDGMVRTGSDDAKSKELFERWRIVRRMLTRYNWLSTRVGDDPVPLVGIIRGSFDLGEEGGATAYPTLVPLRQRRFVELLGRHWERQFYADSLAPEAVHLDSGNPVIVDPIDPGEEDEETDPVVVSIGS